MTLELRSPSAAATQVIGETIGAYLDRDDVVVLAGDLGAGKTTMAKGIARGLGVTEPVTSPTFAIVQQYEGRVVVSHVDVYRLDTFQELFDLGLEEVIDGRVTLVEWGDAVEPALPADRLEVRLTLGAGDDERAVEVVAQGRAWSGRVEALREALLRCEAAGYKAADVEAFERRSTEESR
jgi:tRNA threonylcarbamoyladenosine biosynthesis protein TsaE